MKLKTFQVKDFRSVNDSGVIEVAEKTALLGRNESGKTTLLKVLQSLNPADRSDLPTFGLARHYPRDRKRSSFSDSIIILETDWELTDEERKKIGELWPRGKTAKTFNASRAYKPKRYGDFSDAEPLEEWAKSLALKRHDLGIVAAKAGASVDHAALSGAFAAIEAECSKLQADLAAASDPTASAGTATGAVAALKAALKDTPFAAESEAPLSEIEAIVSNAATDRAKEIEAIHWAFSVMPKFVYLDEFETVPGHHDINGYLDRGAGKGDKATPDDRLFNKLLKVSELDANELKTALATNNHEERNLLTNRAEEQVTATLRKLWKDRDVRVELAVDERHFDVNVSDVETRAKVPLDERSRGFRWYFSFFITFAADTDRGDKSNAILLLDEPGLFLHATAQESLLRFFEELPNQIIYTTHSPFMISAKGKDLGSVRTVNLAEKVGTTVTNNPTGDANTLFPLQAALGYDLTQTMFIGAKSVVVEGVTDYWYISSVADYLRDSSRCALDSDVVITPAGGAQKVPYMVALLTAQNLQVALLLDSEQEAERTRKELLETKLIRSDGVVLVADTFPAGTRKEADIEDVIDENVFMDLVREAFAKELAGKAFKYNAAIPRIVKRMEDAFDQLGMKFNKTRIARLFLAKMGTDPAKMLAGGADARFEELLRRMQKAVEKVSKAEPFR